MTDSEPCPVCDGHGRLTSESDDIVTTECPRCDGEGVIPPAIDESLDVVDVWW